MIRETITALLLDALLPLALTALLAAVTWVITRAAGWLRGKAELVKLERIRAAFEQLVDAAEIAAKETAQTLVDKLKAAAADGKLEPHEARAALQAAVERAWGLLAPEIREILIGLFGSEAAVKEQALAPAIEAVVRDLPRPAAPADVSPAALERDAALARQRLGLLP